MDSFHFYRFEAVGLSFQDKFVKSKTFNQEVQQMEISLLPSSFKQWAMRKLTNLNGWQATEIWQLRSEQKHAESIEAFYWSEQFLIALTLSCRNFPFRDKPTGNLNLH